MNLLKTLAGCLALTIIWTVSMAASCVIVAVPVAIGLTLIALFGRAIGAF